MHEYSMTLQIINAIKKEAERHAAVKVLETKLVIGEFTFLNPEQITFWYNTLSEGDRILGGSRLEIEVTPGKVECSHCGYRGSMKCEEDPAYHIVFPTLLCPKCGRTVKVISGRECTIKRIRMIGREESSDGSRK